MLHSKSLNLLFGILFLIFRCVESGPTVDCRSSELRLQYAACEAGDYSRCCPVGVSCCAGGCCNSSSNCLNVDTDNEVCCPATDATLCGTQKDLTDLSPLANQRQFCVALDLTGYYWCPSNATCNAANNDCLEESNNETPTPTARRSSSGMPPPSSTVGSGASTRVADDNLPSQSTMTSGSDTDDQATSTATTTGNPPNSAALMRQTGFWGLIIAVISLVNCFL